MLKTLIASGLLAFALTTGPSTSAFAEDSEVIDRAEVQAIIRSYLLENPELIEEVQQALETKRQVEAAQRSAEALERNAEIIFNSDNQAVIGNPEGDVTVVEFFDYNCGFCQRAMNDMNALLSEDDNIRFVLKELPILGPGSVSASQFSTAVYRLFPARYEEFHNRLLGIDVPKDGGVARTIASDMGLDMEALNAEADKSDVIDAFREANTLANDLGVTGTPSYVIGNEVVFGAVGVGTLRDKIENMRECGSTVCS